MNLHDGFNCLFSRLDPFLVLSSELFVVKFRVLIWNKSSVWRVVLPSADFTGFEFWEARRAGEAAVIGMD